MDTISVPSYRKGQPLFPLGKVFITPTAQEALTAAGQSSAALLERHGTADFGELNSGAAQRMDEAVTASGEIISCYRLQTGIRIWVRTTPNRTETTLHLRSDEEQNTRLLRPTD